MAMLPYTKTKSIMNSLVVSVIKSKICNEDWIMIDQTRQCMREKQSVSCVGGGGG